MGKRKTFEQLSFTDNFIFGKVMAANDDLAKKIIELILEIKIKGIRYIEREKDEKVTAGAKGSRFDAYIETDDGRLIDVEMQTRLKHYLPRRMRYYQDVSDLSILEAGDDYEKLPESYIIFIVLDDPYDRDYYRYTFENRCIEDLNLSFGDDTKKIYINASGDVSEATDEMRYFLEYIKEGRIMSDLTKEIDEAVSTVKMNPALRVEYMSMFAHDCDIRREEREEGRREGRMEGVDILEDVIIRLRQGEKPEDIISGGVDADIVRRAARLC